MRELWGRLVVSLVCGLVLGAAAYAMTVTPRLFSQEAKQTVLEERIERIDQRVEDLWKLYFDAKTTRR